MTIYFGTELDAVPFTIFTGFVGISSNNAKNCSLVHGREQKENEKGFVGSLGFPG